MKYEFGICGAFDFSEKGTGGQSVKTREFYYALCEEIGKENVFTLESTSYKSNPIRFLVSFLKMLRDCCRVVVFPAQNGVRIFAPLCHFFKGKCEVYYSVIGGWLPQMLEQNRWLRNYLNSFSAVFVETNVMKGQLEALGITNAHRLLNFKRLQPMDEASLPAVHSPLKVCYFSRVLQEKGIEDAIDAIKSINQTGRKCLFDIYGPVVDEYRERFEEIKRTFPEEIRYCGLIDPSESVNVLKEYDVQLFPTRYKTEGIPGSIVDSYYAGVPVVSSRWNSFEDVVIDGVTGFGYEMGNASDMTLKLDFILNNPAALAEMKKNCLAEAQRYTAHSVMQDFFSMISQR